MEIVELFRNRKTEDEKGIIGTLFYKNELMCYTYELPWKENQRDISCIPPGNYETRLAKSQSKGRCFKLENVTNRNNILIHIGNMHKNTRGCILVGRNKSTISVLDSMGAMGVILNKLPNKFTLSVINQIKE